MINVENQSDLSIMVGSGGGLMVVVYAKASAKSQKLTLKNQD